MDLCAIIQRSIRSQLMDADSITLAGWTMKVFRCGFSRCVQAETLCRHWNGRELAVVFAFLCLSCLIPSLSTASIDCV